MTATTSSPGVSTPGKEIKKEEQTVTPATEKKDDSAQILSRLLDYMADHGYSSPHDFIGKAIENVTVVEYTGSRGGAFGHSYFRDNPAVSSDVILVLRYDRPPGAEHGRPLEQVGPRFYRIDDTYLAGD